MSKEKEEQLKEIEKKIQQKLIEKSKIDIELIRLKNKKVRIMIDLKEKITFEKIGKSIGVSRQRIHQLLNKNS